MLKQVLTLAKHTIVNNTIKQSLSCQLQQQNYLVNVRKFSLTSLHLKEDKRALIKAQPKKDDGTDGERVIDIDSILTQDGIFPDEHTPNKLFNGIPFKDIPIINIKCTKNNTLMSVNLASGLAKVFNSCGCEGYKHARKGTNIAAQATAISLSHKALDQGFKTVRVRVRGIGPGRAAALKGLQMGGMDIISVTDSTRVTWTPLRPRKARRV